MNNQELDITLVDFSRAEDVSAFAKKIFTEANKQGMFVRKERFSKEQMAVRLTAQEWINRVEESIDSLSNGDALTIIASYDIIHRIAFSVPAKTDYLDKYKMQVFEAFIRGDKTVDKYFLFQVISQEIRRGNKAYFGRHLKWESLCLDRWYKNFRTGRCAVSQSDYDTASQISALLAADLYAFTPDQDGFKRRLIAGNPRHLPSLQS